MHTLRMNRTQKKTSNICRSALLFQRSPSRHPTGTQTRESTIDNTDKSDLVTIWLLPSLLSLSLSSSYQPRGHATIPPLVIRALVTITHLQRSVRGSSATPAPATSLRTA